MPNAIVLMTALVPTIGHKYLIDFAKNLVGTGSVHVILGSLDREPVNGELRYQALLDTYSRTGRVKIHHLHRDVPQEPSEHPDFWAVWRDIVREFVDVQPNDYFVASELYGMDMANVLGCKFMPCNRYRETIPIKGSTVRTNLLGHFDYILPAFQPYLRKTITIFGAESCGKTTMTKRLARDMNGHFVPEWAREYLETVGSEVTDKRMRTIIRGQAALQRTAQNDLLDKPFIFQDTDLFSTLGYYGLWDGGTDHDVDLCEYLAKQLKSDFYIVMNDGIPFEPDPLRYGVDKRESTANYWIDLLKQFNLPYLLVPSADHETQAAYIKNNLYHWYEEETKAIRHYAR